MGWLLLASGVLINVSGLFIIKGTQASEQFFVVVVIGVAGMSFTV